VTVGVGQETADKFNEAMGYDDPDTQNPFNDKVWSPADEHGCHRPVVAFPTPGWFNHGMGGEFQDGQEAEALAHRNQEYRKYGGQHNRLEEWEAKCSNPLTKHPSCLSVAIFFNQQPTDDEVAIMRARAMQFAAERPDLYGIRTPTPITITGFRLLTEVTTHTELKSWDV